MSVRIVRLALAATVAAAGAATASDGPLPSLPSPTVVHAPPGSHLPAIEAHAEAHHHPPAHPEAVAHGHSMAPSHAHHEEHVHGHCMPGVYKSEITRFRGNGPVARKRPYTPKSYSLERSGNPQEISHLAEPSYDPHYTGYFVGGGASLFKGPGFPHRFKEGTWGWDYEHVGLKRRVQLLFSRGALYQDGDGQYEADPPYEIPNVFLIRYGERIHRLLGHEAE